MFTGIGIKWEQQVDSINVKHHVPHDLLTQIRPWVLQWEWLHFGKGATRGVLAYVGLLSKSQRDGEIAPISRTGKVQA